MAGKKTFTAGEVLTAGDVNDYLMDQTIMVFSGTAVRATAIPFPSEGMFTVTTDNDQVDYYNGSAWVSALPIGSWTAYTPTFGGGGFSIGNATLDFVFCQIGKIVFVRGSVTWGSTTSTTGWTSGMTISVPATMAASQATTGNALGTATTRDVSAPKSWAGSCFTTGSTTTLQPNIHLANFTPDEIELTPIRPSVPMTFATGDQIFFNFNYEAA